MKKYFFTACVMAVFAIGFAASDDSESSSSSVTQEEIPTNVTQVDVVDMLLDLEQNEMRAQKKYSNKWFNITGILGSMDSEGEYFSLRGDAFGMTSVHCKIPADKREEITDKLVNMEKGDHIVVKGKVTDMGEIMGYYVTIVEVRKKY